MDQSFTVTANAGKTLLSLQVKEWESDFLGKKFGQIVFDPSPGVLAHRGEIRAALLRLLEFADKHHFCLLELQCTVSAVGVVPIFEELGFRLVDTRISFVTLIETPLLESYTAPVGQIEWVMPDDLDEIISLTHTAFTHNPEFFSRYKNAEYFSPSESEKYYAAWIENHIADPDTLFAVIKDRHSVLAYSFFKSYGRYRGEKLYKALLTAVDPQSRGHRLHLALQSFLLQSIPENRFYLDNTTQLTNIPAIRNSISSRKTLTSIGMVYYREHPNP